MPSDTPLLRLSTAFFVLAAIVMIAATFAGVPSFVEHTSEARIQQQLSDIDGDRGDNFAAVLVSFAAAAVVIIAGAALATRLRDGATPFALASAGFAVAGAILLVVAGAFRLGLIEVADSVADGDTSSSTLLLGRTMSLSLNVCLAIGMQAFALWIASSSAGMLRSAAFSRGIAFSGIAAGAFTLLGLLGDLSDAFYSFSMVGFLCAAVWAGWIVVSLVRAPGAEQPSSGRERLAAAGVR